MVTNTGSAPVTNVTLSGSAPTNWKVEFDPATVAVDPRGPDADRDRPHHAHQRRDRGRLRR